MTPRRRLAVLVVVVAVVAALGGTAKASPSNSLAPTVTGDFTVGGSLSADPGSWTGSGAISYGYQWQDCESYAAAVLADSPTSYYRMDDVANPDGAAATLTDSSGHGNDGKYGSAGATFGASGQLAGDPDTAAALNGSTQYASMAGTFPTGRDPVTLEVWFDAKVYPTTGRESLVGYGDTTTGDWHQLFLGVNGNKPELRYGTTATKGTTTLVAGTWYQLAAVDTGTSLQLYVNGVLDTTVANPGASFSKANGQAQIGRFTPGADSGTYPQGTVDEAAVYPSALTAAQLSDDYRAGTLATGTGCADIAGAADQVYLPQATDAGARIGVQVTATDSGGSTTAASAVQMVTGNGSSIVVPPTISGDPEQGQTLTANEGLWSGLSFAPSSATYQWQRCGYQATVLGDQPLSYLRLGEQTGSTAADLGSLGADGTYVAFPALSQTGALNGDPNTAVSFAGNGQSVTLPGTFPTGHAPVSVDAWVKPASNAAGAVGGYGDGLASHTFGLSYGGSPLKAEIWVTGNHFDGSTTLSTNEWYYLAGVYDGTNLFLYVNGKLDGTFAPGPSFDPQNGTAAIGALPGLSGGLAATVDDFAIYGSALTADQIGTHYQVGVQESTGLGCQDIAGASGSFDALGIASYTVTGADNGTKLRIRVFVGGAEADSDTVVVSTSAPAVSGLPTISGDTAIGSTLSTTTGDWTGTQPISYSYQWNTCGYQDAVMADSPIGYWRLGDDPNQLIVLDSSSLGNDGDLTTNNAGTANGVLGLPGALSGDGDTAALFANSVRASIADNAVLDPTSYSFEGWFRPTSSSPPQSGSVVNKLAASKGWQLYWSGPNDHLVASVSSTGGGAVATTTTQFNDPTAWHQVVVTAANQTLSIYVDGGLQASAPYTGTLTQSTGTPVTIGNSPIAIDDFSYYATGLTASEVQTHFASASCTPIAGETGATHAVTSSDVGKRLSVSVSAANAAGNATAYSQTFEVAGTSVPVNTVLPAVSGDWSIGSPLTADDGTWSSDSPVSYAQQWQDCTYNSVILSDHPDAYWPLDESGGPTVTDISGNQVDGTAAAVNFGLPGALADAAGRAVRLGGTGSGIEAPAASVLDNGNNVSVEAWVHLRSTATKQIILDKGYYGSTVGGVTTYTGDFQLRVDAGGKIELDRSDGTGGTMLVTSSATFPVDGQFHQVVATAAPNGGGTAYHLYLDGTDVTGPLGGGVGLQNSEEPLEFGMTGKFHDSGGNGGGVNAFTGDMDEVAIYPAALTAARVAAHYQAAQSPCTDIAGATGTSYTLLSSDVGNRVRVKVTATNSAGSSAASSLGTFIADNGGSANLEPVDGADVQTTTPVLSRSLVAGSTYEFDVASTADFITEVGHPEVWVKSSGWQAANNFSVPSTWHLKTGATYWWHVRTESSGGVISAWAGPNKFTVQLAPSGEPDYWAMWKSGPLAVNLANGNLVFTPPTPSYPTANSSLSFALAFNSLDTGAHSLGQGWLPTIGSDFGTPPVLTDYSVLGGQDEVVAQWPDGSVSVYNHVAGSSTYKPPAGDSSALETDGAVTAGHYTLTDPGGSVYSYGPADPTTGLAKIQSAEIVDAQAGKAPLTYTLDSTNRVTKIADEAGRALTFTWPTSGCTGSGCFLQVTGPDNVTWKYFTATAGAPTGQITSISDGTRTLYQLTYNASRQLTEIQDANDLDSAHASPGYNGSHNVAIQYDSQGRVVQVTNGPITGQTPGSSTTSFAYSPGDVLTAATQAVHTIPPDGYPWDRNYAGSSTTLSSGSRRTAAGYTVVTPPNLQGTGGGVTTYYDGLDHPMETDDELGRVVQEQYDSKNQLIWSEDAAGHPTDRVYDPVTDELLNAAAPAPTSSASRPTTYYGYDELTSGTYDSGQGAYVPGLLRQGLQGAYYANINLAGRPVTRTDKSVNFNWGAGGPSTLPGTVSNFSARWTGLLDVEEAGAYTLYTYADSGTRLTIDDDQVISNWKDQPATLVASQPIQLSRGEHKIDLDYYVKSGTAQVQLKWRCASCGISTEIIPAASLAPNWGNPTTMVDPLGRVSFSHYASPQLAHPDYTMALPDTTDPVSPAVDPVTSFAYDAFGRVVKKTMPKGNAARTLDSMGSLSGAPDSRFTTVYGYYAANQSVNGADQGEQLKSTTQHGLAATTYSYDAAGRVLSKTNGRGTTTYTYDGEGRLTSEEAPGDAQATTFTYDPSGAQLSTSDASGTLSTQYDEAGRTTETTDSFGAVATFTYDADGNRLSRTATPIPGGSSYTTDYSYDTADELTSETDPASHQWSFYYDTRGNLEATQYPNGTFSWTDVNPDGWTSDLLNRHGTLPVPLPGSAPADSQGSPVADFTYTYNQAGQKLTESRTAGSTTDSTSYDYDQMGRLDQATLPSGTVRQYTFDLDSNRTSVVDDGTTTVAYTYNPATTPGVDELTSVGTTSYSYNADGEVTGYGSSTVTWDGWQRMSGGSFGGSSVSYSYDAGGALRTRTGGAAVTNYLLGDVFETDGSGSITTSYTDGPAGDLAEYAGAPSPSTTPSYLYYNGHGDLAAEADATGTRTALHTYDPFGAPLDAPPANSTTHRFTGRWDKQDDSTSGLILMGARPYDPSLGRFLAVDPIDGGSLNNYDYAAQDPINKYDLAGTTSTPCDELWRTMMRLAFAHRTRAGSGTKGLFDRYFEMLEKGVDPGHAQAFEEQQTGLRNLLNQFRSCGCKPPGGDEGAAAYKDINWIATRKTPTQADSARFKLQQAAAGGGMPILTIGSGVPTITFATSSWVFIWAP